MTRSFSRVVGDHLDDARLDRFYRIGVDKISYKRGPKFLTIVADHGTGNAIWVDKGRNLDALTALLFVTLRGRQHYRTRVPDVALAARRS